ncbi:MAG: hypothetical protein WBM40_16995 [Thiohalocapsa sp.]
MKKIASLIALASFATAAGATDIYQQFSEGNPDLRAQPNEYMGTTQRGVGASVDRYQGWADGNGDLFRSSDVGISDPHMSDHQLPDVYRNFNDNPDL